MKLKTAIGTAFILCCCLSSARAQDSPQGAANDARASEARVPLDGEAAAYDIDGRTALVARLRTTALAGSPDAPERNTRIVIENRSPVFYTYASGWATFYGADGVRCGEGLWKLESLAPNESAEVDTPGLRLTCAPTTWRVAAANLLTRTTDIAKPSDESAPPPAETAAPTTETPPLSETTPPPVSSSATNYAPALPPLEISINGKTIPIQPGNPLEIVVGKERVRIVLRPAP